jgi:hypothetical protein
VVSTEPSSTKDRCAVHPDRTSVGACQECRRPSCLSCAIPFRGRLLCRTCASRALGSPDAEEASVPEPSTRPELVAGAILAVGVLATIPPWHRAGSLSGILSAWSPTGEIPVFVAFLCMAGAAAVILWAALAHRPGPGPAAVAAVLSGAASLAIAFSLLRAPDFYAFTPAPFVALAAAIAASIVGALRARSLTRPPTRSFRVRTRV